MKILFTSESVTSGHPDKICDQISDAILDAYLAKDKDARVACEVCANQKEVVIMGEITSKATVDIEKIARKTIIDIGYDREELQFNGNTIPIRIDLQKQSEDIALGVNRKVLGAGDQGMVFGYATDETESYMPTAIDYAHKLARQLEMVRKKKVLSYLRPDGKTQVTVEYENHLPKRIDSIVIAAQHEPEIDLATLQKDIKEKVIKPIIPSHLLDEKTHYYINQTGRFILGGPSSDTGLTGRKIMVDTYGSYSRHGGGAFSGKDATKVDRSGAYYARYVAKNIVAAHLAKQIEIQVSYAIGYEKPLSIFIDTHQTNTIPEEKILKIIHQLFDFSPQNMMDELSLCQPIFQKTTCYGHFGKDLPWEKLDKVDKIKELMTQ